MDKPDKYDDLGRDQLDSPSDAWRRAEILLDAHHKLADTFHTPADVPGYAVERLITDLMHYAHEHNKARRSTAANTSTASTSWAMRSSNS